MRLLRNESSPTVPTTPTMRPSASPNATALTAPKASSTAPPKAAAKNTAPKTRQAAGFAVAGARRRSVRASPAAKTSAPPARPSSAPCPPWRLSPTRTPPKAPSSAPAAPAPSARERAARRGLRALTARYSIETSSISKVSASPASL